MPKYMLLAFEAPEHLACRRDPTANGPYLQGWMAFSRALGATKTFGAALKGPETATTLRMRQGRRIIEDGPFTDTREQLGGFCILEAEDLETALDWAARCPAADGGRVDVRPVLELQSDI